MTVQAQHYNSKFVKKQFPITIICDSVNSPANIGSIFRIADSFGVSQIYFCGKDITVISKRMLRTARATHEIVHFKQAETVMAATKELLEDGYTFIALEITENSIPVSEYKFDNTKKLALIIGEENHGVSEDILQLVEQSVHINMYGNNSSMNVATATGVALYEITKQWS